MKRLTALGALTLLVAILSPVPAAARDYVQDQAGMFSQQAIRQADERIAAFNSATGKEIVVVTVPSLAGSSLQDAAAKAFAQQSVNGVLIFIARDDRRDIIVSDRAGSQAGWFTPDVLRSIRSQMETQFHSEAFDGGLLAGVDGILAVYRSHTPGNVRSNAAQQGASGFPAAQNARTNGGLHISMFWWIIIVVVGFLILRSVMRAFAAPRYGAPGMPPGAHPPGGVLPGGMPPAGYGPGYGGGGGSFWSGLLGGLGGAWLGNEMFGRGGGIGSADAAQSAQPDAGGSWGGDSGAGWQSDAGQADMSGASGGDWSGGGFGDGGGGGGDFGGGGDSGGGW